jgi:hypothetical protein
MVWASGRIVVVSVASRHAGSTIHVRVDARVGLVHQVTIVRACCGVVVMGVAAGHARSAVEI